MPHRTHRLLFVKNIKHDGRPESKTAPTSQALKDTSPEHDLKSLGKNGEEAPEKKEAQGNEQGFFAPQSIGKRTIKRAGQTQAYEIPRQGALDGLFTDLEIDHHVRKSRKINICLNAGGKNRENH